ERIYENPISGHKIATLEEWFDDLLDLDVTPAYVAAVRIAAILVEGGTAKPEDLPVVLTTNDQLVQPLPVRLFIASPEITPSADLDVVAAEVAADEDAMRALEQLGIRRLDPLGELEAYLADGFDDWRASDWQRFWTLARAVDSETAARIIRERDL